ncbi:hypothetical protein DRF65_04715 [Chryseobacterium pennae]|uniref:Uncharacterized protein n=1 Tax=Chryseobacterium pennae TaxID=2258962 RepID=A0A3D9CCE8_9FLAO|nr:hypothetical protein DRF65_04715 [Chryseobacterium pennae]
MQAALFSCFDIMNGYKSSTVPNMRKEGVKLRKREREAREREVGGTVRLVITCSLLIDKF